MRATAVELQTFIKDVLTAESVDETMAERVAEGLVHASIRGVDSHGVRLLPHYLDELDAGRVTRNPTFDFDRTAGATGILDADHGFGHAAGMEASERAINLAAETGVGTVAVTNSNHFGACSYYSLTMAHDGLIGISMTHSDSLVVPTGGIRSFLGNNPISIAAPAADEDPVCLDMATSKITFNEVLKRREEGQKVPPGSGVDADGKETRDPEQVTNLKAVGGYKGYGLGLMIEILCALLTGMDYGPNLTKMYDDAIKKQRNLGHFFLAIDIEAFDAVPAFKSRVQTMIDEARTEPSRDGESIKVPGDPEKEKQREREAGGIPLREIDIENFEQLAEQYGVSAPDTH